MNLAELQGEVALICGNMPSSHPMYALFITPAVGSENQSVINRAANKFIAYAVGANGAGAALFPELRNSWTAGPTVVDQNYISLPSDAVVITDVASARSGTLPNWSTTREYPLDYIDPVLFGNLVKDSTVANYPSIWSKKGKNILVWPTPDATHIDYLREYGLKIENVLSDAADVFFMNVIWHDFVALLAAQMLSLKLGWYEQADSLWTQFKEDLAATMNVTAMEQQPFALEVQDAPTRFSVSGR